MDTFGIPAERVFSSRSRDFAPKLMRATKGKGVEVILNSLAGVLLDETWRCVADGGIMVEIGKKDILDRNSLSMEPFNRNACYRALDMAHKSITPPVFARLLSRMFQLILEGHIKPIYPMKIFSFSKIADAFRYMRGGSHIGKIVISDGPERNVRVPIRPAYRILSLRKDISYLIVGGLKGLCGSLAIYLARCGARHLTVLSRSGYHDKKSQGVLRHLDALGAKVDLTIGDVSKINHVQSLFQQSTKPIGGVIHGAMVLRVHHNPLSEQGLN